MRVVEIFKSIEGEGKRSGMVCTFIRLFGCNLKCSYCDTVYGWDEKFKKDTVEMTVKDIVMDVVDLGCECVTITGGEPLIHDDIYELIEQLLSKGFWVNVETNGSIYPELRRPSLFYTMDFKTLSSGMSDKMNLQAIKDLRSSDVLKFVVGSVEDMNQAVQVLQQLTTKPTIYFSPVFGTMQPKEIVEYIIGHKLHHCQLQLQLHKLVWDPDKRGV